ncbi:MAG: nucleotidyl transferase AbiEii/AbiGii toxin family protein [Patescibacteria group bacterium]|nr:nucleotidyl transferase AbiEii/AbiGii toxin family protein [Patescibacteria group bacterium]
MFYNILDKKRLAVLPLLENFKKDFYLAGGTGLALQLGHRDSIDFDFFSSKDFDTEKLFAVIKKIFSGHKILKVQEEKNTLTVFIDENIKLSFFAYKYKLLKKLVNEPYFNIASVLDIAVMKLSAVVSRATNKDYIDLFFILKELSLAEILIAKNKKMPELDSNLVLKSLVYFQDIKKEPIKFKNNRNIDLQMVKDFFVREVQKISK